MTDNINTIKEIKSYLYNYDFKRFYGDYVFNGETYKASNLLFSLIISYALNTEFKYYEDIDVFVFGDILRKSILSNNDLETKKRIVALLTEILNITDYTSRMNTVTFSYHDVLTGKLNFSDLVEDLKNNLNEDMRFSLSYIDKKEKEMMSRMEEAKNPLMQLVKSKARGNQKQLAQEFLAIGYKVDTCSNILKKPVITSFIDGINTREDFYCSAIGARNAIIQGTNYVAKSGYLNRKLCFATIDVWLSKTKDCGSTNYLEVLITEQNKDSQLNGRYILEDGKLKLIKSNMVNDYIGKVVKLRSPITCSCSDGICETCYGYLSKLNKGLCIGIIAATSIAEIITQALLSTKHLLNAAIHKDNPYIMKYIDIDHDNDTITCIDEVDIKITNTGKIFINNEEFLHNFKNLKFKGETFISEIKETIEFKLNNGDILFTNIHDYVNSDMNSLLKVLNMVFEKNHFMKDINDYNEYYKYMLELMLILGNLPSIHSEIILSQMVRTSDDISKLWRQNQNKEQKIISIEKSNLSNNLSTNILFERIKETLVDLNNYISDKKHKTKYELLFRM